MKEFEDNLNINTIIESNLLLITVKQDRREKWLSVSSASAYEFLCHKLKIAKKHFLKVHNEIESSRLGSGSPYF